jgi:hypothetical protein
MSECAVKAEFVYLSTHGVRSRDLQMSTADHRDECKQGCRVQDSVAIRVVDMGGQVRAVWRVCG